MGLSAAEMEGWTTFGDLREFGGLSVFEHEGGSGVWAGKVDVPEGAAEVRAGRVDVPEETSEVCEECADRPEGIGEVCE